MQDTEKRVITFDQLSPDAQYRQYNHLKGEIDASDNPFQGKFLDHTCEIYNTSAGDELSFCFLGLNAPTYWNTIMCTVKARYDHVIQEMAHKAFSTLGIQIPDRKQRLSALGNLTYNEWLFNKCAILANSGQHSVQCFRRINKQHHHGYRLVVVIDEPEITINTVINFIEQFRQQQESERLDEKPYTFSEKEMYDAGYFYFNKQETEQS